MKKNSPAMRSFRLVCTREQIPLVEDLLGAQGFRFESEPFSPVARRLTHEPLPLGSSLAAMFGYIYIQDRSSMLPPLMLNPPPGAAVLDMCASPGSKTGFLGQLVGRTGFALGNEPSKARLATLRRNLQLLNLFCCCTCSYPGEKLPLRAASWDRIQLDPPCSGWGTAEKNPQVLQLWQGDKVKPLIALQRRLLAEAARLLAPGGCLVYSTCTTNTEENEEQLRYALNELGLEFMPLTPPPGFAFADPACPEFAGALRVATGEDGQGFFVALLGKPEHGDATRAQAGPEQGCAPPPAPKESDAGLQGGVFVRPWEKESRFVGERRRHGKAGDRKKHESGMVEELPRSILEEAYADQALLPEGRIAVFNGVPHFLPKASGELLPQNFVWKGFPLGKIGKGGEFRLSPHLRGLMPDAPSARKQGLSMLDLDDPALLLPLLQGQSLPAGQTAGEIGLYFRGLPLCRLTVKGSRAMLSPR